MYKLGFFILNGEESKPILAGSLNSQHGIDKTDKNVFCRAYKNIVYL